VRACTRCVSEIIFTRQTGFMCRASYILLKYGKKQLSSATYLSEAEPFLEQYAKQSAKNRALVGAAGSLVSSENFLAIIEGDRDEEGDLHPEVVSHTPTTLDRVPKDEGLIVFFPGMFLQYDMETVILHLFKLLEC